MNGVMIEPATARAYLLVPGASSRFMEKTRSLAIDSAVIDLAGAAEGEKERARAAAVAALEDPDFAPEHISVRINDLRTPWGRDDLLAVAPARARLHSIAVPGVTHAADLDLAEVVLDGRGGPGVGIDAIVETDAAARALAAEKVSSRRLASIVRGNPEVAGWLVVQVAHGFGVRAVDGPFEVVDDKRGLRAAAAHAAELGFDAMCAVHPAQLESIVTAFSR